ncbi:YopX family protein [Lysinibacillus mangiferihumi]|uniref:YopX family protein n=1 Tax=Lysinibacillus mangiferihumi TaxID=1130819 RepID=UPI00142E4324|nr:YopX family protein [Lysinibacillus mangiferihumi]
MSREIKFRAWVENEHIKNGPYPFMNQHIEFMGGLINDIFATSGKEPLNSLHNKITYMQYTGLKDAKGKEIYEGDIVDYLGDIDHINSNVLRVIEYKNEEACFVARLPVGVDGEEAVYLNEHDFKVVGNIYENPTLLEELQNGTK